LPLRLPWRSRRVLRRSTGRVGALQAGLLKRLRRFLPLHRAPRVAADLPRRVLELVVAPEDPPPGNDGWNSGDAELDGVGGDVVHSLLHVDPVDAVAHCIGVESDLRRHVEDDVNVAEITAVTKACRVRPERELLESAVVAGDH